MKPLASAACALAVALVGCPARAPGIAPAGDPASVPPSGTPPTARPPATSDVLRGTATYLERIKAPPGGRLDVVLVEAGSGAPVAGVTVRDVAGPPIPFSLRPPAGAHGPFAVRATLLGPDDARWFATDAPVPVVDTSRPVTLVMRRVAGAASVPRNATGMVRHWECGELGVATTYSSHGDAVDLAFNGRRLALRTRVGGGYANAAGDDFALQPGARARLTLAGEAPRDCTEAAQVSPWNAAAARGVEVRAVGNEPGWMAEIAGTPAVLTATLDYGERTLRVPVRVVDGDYIGRADDGGEVRLRLERRSCQDGMSGQPFEAVASLRVGDRDWRGCGAWLRD